MSEFGVNEIIFGQGTENEKSFMNKVLQLLQDRDSELKELVVKHIKNNWYSSLGYGEESDRKVYENACDELYWIVDEFGITPDSLLETK